MNEIEVKAENNSSGVTVVGSDAPTDYHVAPRADVAGAPAISPTSTAVGLMKKRGRPRKYGPAGPVTVALRAKPISAAGPAGVIDFSAQKRPKIKPAATVASAAATVVKQHQPKFETENIGERVSGSVGANFTPHIITVNAGEDVMMKVISFSQQGPRAICILSANGMISSVTLRQPSSSGGTLTYEGRFEILSLMGSFTPSERGGIRNRSGGLSVSLASPDGRVIGGGVAGMLIASSPVQIVVGSFLAAGNQHEEKPKKQKSDYIISGPPTSTVNFSSVGLQENYVVQRHPAPAIGYSSFREDTRNGSTDLNDS